MTVNSGGSATCQDVGDHFRKARAAIRAAGRNRTRLSRGLAREHGPRAIQVLAQLMNDEKVPASTRALAADRILDRAYGKPPQLNTTDAEQFRRAADLTDDELARIASGGQATDPAEQVLDPKKVH